MQRAAAGTGFSQLSIPEVETEASGVQRPGRKRIHRASVPEVGQAPEQSLGPQGPLFLPWGPGRSESVLGPARPGLIGCDPSPKMHSGHLSLSCTGNLPQRSLETNGFPDLDSSSALNSPARTSHLPTRGESFPLAGGP